MIPIDVENKGVTLINVFTVKPEDQKKLVGILKDATESTMRYIPGFVSATIHKSADGTRVANYAQWRHAEDFQAMISNPKAAEHMKSVRELATNDANLYEVTESYSAKDDHG